MFRGILAIKTDLETSLSASGHYVAHLFREDEHGVLQCYVANDKMAVTNLETQTDQRISPEKSSLFFYKKQPESMEATSGKAEQDHPIPDTMDQEEEMFS